MLGFFVVLVAAGVSLLGTMADVRKIQNCAAQAGVIVERSKFRNVLDNKTRELEEQMYKMITTIAVLALIGGPVALAQSKTNAGSSSGSTAATPRDTNGAPVGHRQPRVSDVPSENSKSGNPAQIDAEEAALDRKIRSICRGC